MQKLNERAPALQEKNNQTLLTAGKSTNSNAQNTHSKSGDLCPRCGISKLRKHISRSSAVFVCSEVNCKAQFPCDADELEKPTPPKLNFTLPNWQSLLFENSLTLRQKMRLIASNGCL